MAAMKLVKNFLMLIFFCTGIEHMKGMQADNETDYAPDTHIVYDQRQSGKYNIHVVIKDVAIIEMDQNEIADQHYNDEEYYYDEDDLTVKPLNIKTTSTTSSKPLDSFASDTTTPTSVQTTASSYESPNISQAIINTNLSVNSSKPSTDVINNNKTTHLMPFLTTHRPAMDTKSRSKVEPIYAIEEPALQTRHRLGVLNYNPPVEAKSKDAPSARSSANAYTNSKIFKVKVHRSHQSPQIMPQRERCRSNQYRDSRGNCRGNRSSSGTILNRLFRMLVTLPFRQDEQQIND